MIKKLTMAIQSWYRSLRHQPTHSVKLSSTHVGWKEKYVRNNINHVSLVGIYKQKNMGSLRFLQPHFGVSRVSRAIPPQHQLQWTCLRPTTRSQWFHRRWTAGQLSVMAHVVVGGFTTTSTWWLLVGWYSLWLTRESTIAPIIIQLAPL